MNIRRDSRLVATDPDMVVLATRGEPIRMTCEILLLARRRTRFLERYGLEVAGRDGFTVVPPDFQGTETHCWLNIEFETPRRDCGYEGYEGRVTWV